MNKQTTLGWHTQFIKNKNLSKNSVHQCEQMQRGTTESFAAFGQWVAQKHPEIFKQWRDAEGAGGTTGQALNARLRISLRLPAISSWDNLLVRPVHFQNVLSRIGDVEMDTTESDVLVLCAQVTTPRLMELTAGETRTWKASTAKTKILVVLMDSWMDNLAKEPISLAQKLGASASFVMCLQDRKDSSGAQRALHLNQDQMQKLYDFLKPRAVSYHAMPISRKRKRQTTRAYKTHNTYKRSRLTKRTRW